jgi:hypothetical protein
MNSPINHLKDLEAALKYAPPRMRDQAEAAPNRVSAPAVEWPWRRHRGDTPKFGSDRAVLELQRQLALDPQRVPEPPQFFENHLSAGRIALRMCGAAGVAAIVAWAIVSVPIIKLLGQETLPAHSTTSLAIKSDEPDSAPTVAATTTERSDTQPDSTDRVALESREPVVIQAPMSMSAKPAAAEPTSVQPQPAVTVRETSPAAELPAPSSVSRQLDRDEVALLVKRGENFMASGDIASARLVLQRAAEAGDASAAFALAGAFDPKLLEKLGIYGVSGDAAMARLWYERAEHLGSPEAPRRLQQLATDLNSLR